MKELLLKQIESLKQEVSNLSEDLDKLDPSHFAKFTNTRLKYEEKSKELEKTESLLNNSFKTAVLL